MPSDRGSGEVADQGLIGYRRDFFFSSTPQIDLKSLPSVSDDGTIKEYPIGVIVAFSGVIAAEETPPTK